MVGEKVMKLWLFGGNSNNGSNCGLAYANSNNGWSNANANISARHTFDERETIRVSVLRHGNAPDYHEPRRRARMYSPCGRNNIHLARVGISAAVCSVSKSRYGKLKALRRAEASEQE